MSRTGTPPTAPSSAVPPSARRDGRQPLGLVRACHPEATAAVTLLITVLAAASGRGPGGCLLVAAAVLSGQLSVGWCNDRVDFGRDLATGREEKPLVSGVVAPRTVAVAAGCALAACVPLSLANGTAAGAAHLAGVGAAWAYNLGVKGTVLSWLPYAVGFGALPAFVTLGLPGHPWPPAWSVAAGSLLGVGAHFANVLPDIDDDLRNGVRGLPQRLGPRRTVVLTPLPLIAASTAAAFGPAGPAGAAGWSAFAVTGSLGAAAALPTRRSHRTRLPFLAAIAMATATVALLLIRGTALA